MNTIFIIGNGFDLAHGLKTSYKDFVTHEKDKSNFSRNIFFFILSQQVNLLNKWCDIEYLYFDLLTHYNDRNYIAKKYRAGTEYGSAKQLNNEFIEVKNSLSNYLCEEEKNFQLFEPFSYMFSNFNNNSTLILNFNYTNTISRYVENYSEVKVINIHGELNNEHNPIIFGFAANDLDSQMLLEKNDNDMMTNIKKIWYLRTDNELKLKRTINDSIYENVDIYVVGHSCGISDGQILSDIFNHEKVDRVNFFYHEDWNQFKMSAINFDRIVGDYSKKDKIKKSFTKLSNYYESNKLIQSTASQSEIYEFKAFIDLISKKQLDKISSSKISFTPAFNLFP